MASARRAAAVTVKRIAVGFFAAAMIYHAARETREHVVLSMSSAVAVGAVDHMSAASAAAV